MKQKSPGPKEGVWLCFDLQKIPAETYKEFIEAHYDQGWEGRSLKEVKVIETFLYDLIQYAKDTDTFMEGE